MVKIASFKPTRCCENKIGFPSARRHPSEIKINKGQVKSNNNIDRNKSKNRIMIFSKDWPNTTYAFCPNQRLVRKSNAQFGYSFTELFSSHIVTGGIKFQTSGGLVISSWLSELFTSADSAMEYSLFSFFFTQTLKFTLAKRSCESAATLSQINSSFPKSH